VCFLCVYSRCTFREPLQVFSCSCSLYSLQLVLLFYAMTWRYNELGRTFCFWAGLVALFSPCIIGQVGCRRHRSGQTKFSSTTAFKPPPLCLLYMRRRRGQAVAAAARPDRVEIIAFVFRSMYWCPSRRWRSGAVIIDCLVLGLVS
jgi:hypothetical protein